MSKKMPLLEELLKYHKEKNLILSMPGNKCGLGFKDDKMGEMFLENMGYMDITEVDPLDNLHCPEGIIKQSQEMLADIYKVKKAYFIVNGSSCGNLASIFSAFNEGDEVLVERNCHKSIYNALILRKLKVTYIEPIIDEDKDIFLPPDKESIYKSIDKCANPKGIILTYPSYFGITYDIEEILRDLQVKGLTTILDAAHGAHFGAHEKLPKEIYSIADYVIISAHKTLPALTQGAYLLVNTEKSNVEFYLRAFMTTSPSYLIMASLDYARYYLDEYGHDAYEKLIDRSEWWKNKINQLGKVSILSKENLKENYDIDLSRYIIILPKGYSGHKFLDYFREKKIQCEMSFSRGVILILSPFNDDNDFKKIYEAIKNLELENVKSEVKEGRYVSHIPQKSLEPYEVFDKEYELIQIENSIGRIAKEAIIPYPPGIPLICQGEVISNEAIDIINEYIAFGRSILGIEHNQIKVIKE